MRPIFNTEREANAKAWAKRVNSEVLAALLSAGKAGSTYYLAAKAEWDKRNAQ